MVPRFWIVFLFGCANAAESAPAEQPTSDSATVKTVEIAFRRSFGEGTCGDGGTPNASPMLSADTAVAMLRDRYKECYTQVLEAQPEARGRIIEAIRVAPDGTVCAFGTSERIGLPSMVATCIEKITAGAHFMAPGGTGTVLEIPVTYVHPHDAWPTVATPDIEHCADRVKQPTEATIRYTTNEGGWVGDVQIDPWKGDQEALGCTADAISKVKHPPNLHFVINARFDP